jgi:hypothetical protein
MKGQVNLPAVVVYDVYLVRGRERLFAQRYKTEYGAKSRALALEDKFAKIGYRSQIELVEIEPPGSEI